MIPFRRLTQLLAGDFTAKVLYFLAFIYLARVLGVASYGVLEFSISVITYFLVLGDGGLELWATRESARGRDPRQLINQVVPLRLLLAAVAFILLLVALPYFPDYPLIRTVLVLFGFTLFAQALSLKWVFMGQELMSRVAYGLAIAQIIFAALTFILVRSPEQLVLVPVLRVAGDLVMAVYFGWLHFSQKGSNIPRFTLTGTGRIIRPALVMGASHGLAFMSYNFDSVLLGFMVGSEAVGWYGAAYKPITAVLAIPVTYFIGLFPTLSRTFSHDRNMFFSIVNRSLNLASILALPIAVGGSFLAAPIVRLLFGPDYANSVLPLQILAWSAALVILRGTYRQALNAAGRQDLDFRCAFSSIAVNIILNLLLIGRYEIIGAAIATVTAEALWLTLATFFFTRHVAGVSRLVLPWQSTIAAAVMAGILAISPPYSWVLQAFFSIAIYFLILLALGESEVRSWLMQLRNVRLSQ